jgi:hypothetical protein
VGQALLGRAEHGGCPVSDLDPYRDFYCLTVCVAVLLAVLLVGFCSWCGTGPVCRSYGGPGHVSGSGHFKVSLAVSLNELPVV